MQQDKELTLYQIFFIFILPIAVLAIGIVPVSWRMIVLCVSMLFMYGVIQTEKISDAEMGLHRSRVFRWWIPYLAFTVVGGVVLIALSDRLGIQPHTVWWESPHLLFLFLPVSILQEVAYRGFLFPKLSVLSRKIWVIVGANVVLFTFLHVIYPMPQIMIPVAFVGGIGFALMYRYFPNLWMIGLSHAVLNFIAVLYGFFYFHE